MSHLLLRTIGDLIHDSIMSLDNMNLKRIKIIEPRVNPRMSFQIIHSGPSTLDIKVLLEIYTRRSLSEDPRVIFSLSTDDRNLDKIGLKIPNNERSLSSKIDWSVKKVIKNHKAFVLAAVNKFRYCYGLGVEELLQPNRDIIPSSLADLEAPRLLRNRLFVISNYFSNRSWEMGNTAVKALKHQVCEVLEFLGKRSKSDRNLIYSIVVRLIDIQLTTKLEERAIKLDHFQREISFTLKYRVSTGSYYLPIDPLSLIKVDYSHTSVYDHVQFSQIKDDFKELRPILDRVNLIEPVKGFKFLDLFDAMNFD